MKTILSVRPGTAPLTEEDKENFKIISSFDVILETLQQEMLDKTSSHYQDRPIEGVHLKRKIDDVDS